MYGTHMRQNNQGVFKQYLITCINSLPQFGQVFVFTMFDHWCKQYIQFEIKKPKKNLEIIVSNHAKTNTGFFSEQIPNIRLFLTSICSTSIQSNLSSGDTLIQSNLSQGSPLYSKTCLQGTPQYSKTCF